MTAPHLTLGDEGEDIALKYLEERGWTLVERNWWRPLGELDLVVKKGDVLAFVEVKSRERRVGEHGFLPDDAMDHGKRAKFTRAARAWLQENQHAHEDLWPRLDLITVVGGRVTEHLEDAFEAPGG